MLTLSVSYSDNGVCIDEQARFYWRPGEDDAHGPGSCIISICDVDFKYRFEYLGCKVIRLSFWESLLRASEHLSTCVPVAEWDVGGKNAPSDADTSLDPTTPGTTKLNSDVEERLSVDIDKAWDHRASPRLGTCDERYT